MAACQRACVPSPVSADGEDFWALTKYEDIRMVSRQPRLFSSYAKGTMVADPDEMGLMATRQMMLNMDPPQHDRFKMLVSRGFTPRNAELLRTRIEELAREIVDDVVGRDECDLVTDIAGRLPSGLIAELMGIPRADGEHLYDLTELMHTTDDAVAPPERRAAAMIEMLNYADGVAPRRGRTPATTSRRRSCKPRSTVIASPTPSSTGSSCCW